ncbi:MAG: hypothetical protein QXS10_05405 [Candidatus Bathyarchaeia archaeon]
MNVKNVGGRNATNVRVWDDLPYNLTLIDSKPSHKSYDISTGRVTWDLGTIGPGESRSISLTVNVTDAKYDGILVFNNVYANWTDDRGTTYGPVTDTHPIQLFINPYVKIVKSGPTEAMAGSTITYTINLSNPTSTNLKDVTLVDYLPARVSYISSSPPGNYDSATHSVSWNLTIPRGRTLSFRVKVKIDSDLPEGTVIADESIVTWPRGSDMDPWGTKIHAPPVRPPVGGTVSCQASFQIIPEALIALTVTMITALIMMLRRLRLRDAPVTRK